jgi:hypothetical protein
MSTVLFQSDGAAGVPVLHLGVVDTFVPSNLLLPIGTSLLTTANESAEWRS